MSKDNNASGLSAAAEAFGGTQSSSSLFANAIAKQNFNDVPDGGGGVLLPVKQDLTFLIQKVESKMSGNNNAMTTLRLVCQDDEYKGTVIFDNVVATEAAAWKAKSLLKATGLLGEDGVPLLTSDKDLEGLYVVAQVKHETYEGTTRNKIAGGFKSVE